MIVKRNVTSQVIQKNNNNMETKSNTGLIAGLTSGLVVVALIILTAAGFVIYRKRKRSKETIIKTFNLPNHQDDYINNNNNSSNSNNDSIFPSPPSSSIHSKPLPPKNVTIPPQSLTTDSFKKHDPLGVPSMILTNNHSLLINEKEDLTPHYYGSALHIPPLITTPTTIYTSTPHSIISPFNDFDNNNNQDSTLNKKNTIQRSLTLNFQSRRPSHQQLSSTTSNHPPSSSSLNRSASVKVTKYDYPITRTATSSSISSNFDDDDLDHIQIKRAFSVKRSQNDINNNISNNNNNSNQLLKPTIKTISRSNSVKSQHRQSLLNNNNSKNEQKLNNEKKMEKEIVMENHSDINNNDDDDDDENEIKDNDSIIKNTAGSDAIQVISVKPTIARIRSLSRKNRQQKIPEENEGIEENEEINDDNDRQKPRKQLHDQSERISMPVSTHSTLADGEITVYWQP
ncbi:unnamed protein product [Cunninghamella blakesleeana]